MSWINKITKPFKENYCQPWVISLFVLVALSVARWIYYHSSIQLHSFTDRAIGIAILHGIDAAHRTSIYLGIIGGFISAFFFGLVCFVWLIYVLRKSRAFTKIEEGTIYILSVFNSLLLLLWNSKLGEMHNPSFKLITQIFYGIILVVFFIWLVKKTVFTNNSLKIEFQLYEFLSKINGIFKKRWQIIIASTQAEINKAWMLFVGILIAFKTDEIVKNTNTSRSIVIVMFISAFILLFLINAIYSKTGPNKRTRAEEYFLLLFSFINIGLIVSDHISKQYMYQSSVTMINAIIVVLLILWLVKKIAWEWLEQWLPAIKSSQLVLIDCIFAFSFLCIYLTATGQAINTSFSNCILLSILWLALLIVSSIVLNRSKIKKQVFQKRWLWAFIPLAFVPITMPLINEVQFTLVKHIVIQPKILMLSLASLLLFWSGWRWKLSYNNPSLINCKKYMNYLYYPLIVATVVLYQNYTHFLIKPFFDMFHEGESLIGPHQFFLFGRIPFIHIWLTHGISDTIYQYLYMAINGGKMLEPMLWKWINITLGFVILFAFLKQWMKAPLAIVLTILLPVESIANQYYQFLLLPPLILKWAEEKHTLSSYLLFWGTIMVLILWRIDFGLASLLASVLYFAVIYFREAAQHNELIWEKAKKNSIAAIVVMGGCFGLWCIITLLNQQSLIGVIKETLLYITIQAPTMAFHWLTDKDQANLPLLQYVLFPGISTAIICCLIYKAILKGEKTDVRFGMIFIVAIISLVISIRTVQRHCLGITNYNPIFFVLSALMFLLWKKGQKASWVLVFLMLFLLHALMFKDKTGMYYTNRTVYYPKEELFNFHTWNTNDSRLHTSDYQYHDVVAFLNSNIKKQQTFFDLSNTPMLYVTAQKEFTNFIIPPHYYATDKVQKIELEKIKEAYEKGQLVFVIMRTPNWIKNWDWNNVDKVPNEIRSYRVTEFIYAHFVPCVEIKGYQIWKDKKIDDNKIILTSNATQIRSINQSFDLIKLPWIWGEFDSQKAAQITVIQQSLINEPIAINKEDWKTFNINSEINKGQGNYLHFKIKSKEEGKIYIQYGNNPSNITFDLEPNTISQDYLIRISSQWEWVANKITEIKIKSDKPTKIEKLFIRSGD